MSIGTSATHDDLKLNVEFNGQSSDAVAVTGKYTGTGYYSAKGVVGYAAPAPGYGYGGYCTGGGTGILAQSLTSGSNGTRYGVYGYAQSGATAYGMYAYGAYSAINYGLYAYAMNGYTPDAPSGDAYGVYAAARVTKSYKNAYGLYAAAFAAVPYSYAYAGYFAGNVHVTGTLTQASDGRFKENVAALDGGHVLAQMRQVQPRSYEYKQDATGRRLGFSQGKKVGFVAQELEEIFPELVREETHVLPSEPAPPDGGPEKSEASSEPETITYKTVDYLGMIPLLVQAIQEQQAEIEALRAEIERLKK